MNTAAQNVSVALTLVGAVVACAPDPRELLIARRALVEATDDYRQQVYGAIFAESFKRQLIRPWRSIRTRRTTAFETRNAVFLSLVWTAISIGNSHRSLPVALLFGVAVATAGAYATVRNARCSDVRWMSIPMVVSGALLATSGALLVPALAGFVLVANGAAFIRRCRTDA